VILRRTLTIPGRTAKEVMDFSSLAYVRQREFSAACPEVNMNTDIQRLFLFAMPCESVSLTFELL
jgi:hypothetical protein